MAKKNLDSHFYEQEKKEAVMKGIIGSQSMVKNG
jgi:hypothetical protein